MRLISVVEWVIITKWDASMWVMEMRRGGRRWDVRKWWGSKLLEPLDFDLLLLPCLERPAH